MYRVSDVLLNFQPAEFTKTNCLTTHLIGSAREAIQNGLPGGSCRRTVSGNSDMELMKSEIPTGTTHTSRR